MGIGGKLRRALAKLIMRAAGDQEKTSCGNLQLCAGIETSIEGVNHDVGQRKMERVKEGRSVEEARSAEGEEETVGVEVALNKPNIETAGIEEEAAEQLEAALGMEVEETGEGEEDYDGTIRALEALEFLTQDAEPSRTTLVDACNGFNKLSRLAMMWTVRQCWPAGTKFAFNCYRH